MWTSESNADNTFSSFGNALGGADCTGCWQQDYSACCETNKIEGCPAFKIIESSPSSYSCKLFNTVIDLASWRAMLVASSMRGSNVNEILCHNVRLTKQHLADLTQFLKSSDAVCSIKLDYVEFASENDESFGSSVISLMTESTDVCFWSLKGNKLDSAFVAQLAESLPILPRLEGLNLSENCISDVGVLDIFKALPYCISLKKIALKRNPISGESLASSAQELVQGQPMGATGEVAMKQMQKSVADKNKSIQASNKSRKKMNQKEIAEVIQPSDRIVNNPGEENKVRNHTMELVDFSNCTFDNAAMKTFIESITGFCETAAEMPEGAAVLMLKVRGVDSSISENLPSYNFCGRIYVQA